MSGNSADGRTWEARVVQHRSVKGLWLGSLRVSSYSCTNARASGRGTPRVQRPESDDRPWQARVVRHRWVKSLWVGIVAGQFRFMLQRPEEPQRLE